MKEFKGTKGGWEYIPPFSDISTSIEVSGIRQGQERIIASIPIHDKWERENDDPNGWKKATYPEQIANANLIAAAPDLLEALQECRRVLSTVASEKAIEAHYISTKAINKALGE